MSGGAITVLFTLGVAFAIPVLWAALGELITEQSGIINVGVEGVMLIGAFGCAWAFVATHSMLGGIAAAIAFGAGCGIVLSLLYVWMAADQIVTGILFNVIAVAGTAVVADQILGEPGGGVIGQVAIPLLSDIPFVGTVLFDQSPLVYVAGLAVLAMAYTMGGTWFGLHVRVIGMRPRAAESAGINVRAVRTAALMIGCMLTAVGGAALVFMSGGGFAPAMTGGRGLIALAVVVVARWNAFWAAAVALLFGVAQAVRFVADQLGVVGSVPEDVLLMFPYVLTILVVAVARGSRYPDAVAVSYRPGTA